MGSPGFSLTSGLVFVILTTCQALTDDDTLRPIISTEKGRIRGTRTFVTNQQTPVDKFLGIPYARPPIGQGRFRRPLEAQSWHEVRETTEYPAACYQKFQRTGFWGDDMWIPTVRLSEDCLYLNIWVPRNIQRPMTKLTTLVWIYGGGFFSGSSDLQVYDGTYLAATRNVIVVSMNYRVGPLGFLSIDSSEARGNVGLLDQSMALAWVYKNIESFGGDHEKITLFGESAGSASVSYHLLGQPSWDYFSSAIMQSGVAITPWAFRTSQQNANFSRLFAKDVGCTGMTAEAVMKCLRQKSASQLMESTFRIGPTVDGTFLTKSPEELVNEGLFKRCNILLGFNTNEQTYFMEAMNPEKFGRNVGEPSISVSEIKNLVAENIFLAGKHHLPNNSLAFENLRQVYVNAVPPEIRGSNVKVVDNIGGDVDFKCPIVQFARAYAQQNLGVYLYHFHHRSPINPWPEWMGVIHGYEIEFVFGMPYNSSAGYTVEDKRISDILMSYWVTFATNGNPNTQTFGERFWPNFTTTEQKYKVLKSDLLETKQYPRYAECSFWRDFVPILETYTDSTALAFARCSGTNNYATLFSIVVTFIVSSFIVYNIS